MSLLDQVEHISVTQFLAEFGHIRLYCTGFKKPWFLFFEGCVFSSISHKATLIKLRAHVNATPSFKLESRPLVGDLLWKRAKIQPHAEVWRRNLYNVLTLVQVVEPPQHKMDQSPSKLTLIN
jgi:hypothetical protein